MLHDLLPDSSTRLILASTSPFRRALLEKTGLPFDVIDPDTGEEWIKNETPDGRAIRLARCKAEAVSHRPGLHAGTLIIGSDQVAYRDGLIFEKPGTRSNARRQLLQCSGHWVHFTTAVCVIRTPGTILVKSETFSVKFRTITTREIEAYLDMDQPWQCAGSIKAESAGILLLEDTRGRDINTLYGLPLMLLREMLTDINS